MSDEIIWFGRNSDWTTVLAYIGGFYVVLTSILKVIFGVLCYKIHKLQVLKES